MAAAISGGAIGTPATAANPMATSFWLRATGSLSNMPIHGRHLNDVQGSDGFYIIFAGAAANLAVASKAGSSFVVSGTGTATVRDGNWHHIGFNYPQTSGTTVELYVDSVLDFSQVAGSNHGALSRPVKFGSTDSTFFSASTCDVAEMAVWSTLLTADEIRALSKGFRPPNVKRNGLLHYVPGIRDMVELLGGALSLSGVAALDHPRVY